MHKNTQRKTYIDLGILLLILITGGTFFSTEYIGKKIEQDERHSLLLRSQMVATMIDTKELASLSGTEKDTITPEYARLKKTLEKIHTLNVDSKFVYIMGIRDNQQFFYVDAENPTSPDFSPPGQLYTDSKPQDIEYHTAGVAYTKGPYTDNWGTFYTAYAPIVDESQKVLGLVGMDIEASKILLKITIAKQAILLISCLLFLSIATLLILTQKSLREMTKEITLK